MNDQASRANESVDLSTPLNRTEVQDKFPDYIIQRSNPHSGTLTILTISNGTNNRIYIEVSEDQYLPVSKAGEDVSDLISEVWANTSVQFMGSDTIAIDPKTAALKVIDGKLIWPSYTEPYVKVFSMDWDYLERMILKDWVLSRAKLNWEEVMLHDAGHWWTPNNIQFIWSWGSNEFAWELELDDENNIKLDNGRLLSKRQWITREWEVKNNSITLIWTKCVLPEWEVLPITLLWEDISCKVQTNQYGNETTLSFRGSSTPKKIVINQGTWEIVTYKKNLVTLSYGHTAQWDTDIWICYNLQWEEVWVVLFDTKTFEVRPITLAWKDVSSEIKFHWNDSSIVTHDWKEYTLDFDTWVLYWKATEVVNQTGDINRITFLWWNIPKWAEIVWVWLLQIDPNDDKFIVRFNTQTGEVEYKVDTTWKIYLELVSKYQNWRIEEIVFYNPETKVRIHIYDQDLLKEIEGLPYVSTQSIIDDTTEAVEEIV